MDINKKGSKAIFVTLGIILLILLFIFGISTYYKGKEEEQDIQGILFDETMKTAEIESNRCLTEAFHGSYRICCEITEGEKRGLFYNCTSIKEYQEYFEPGQMVYIRFNPSSDPLLKTPYFLSVYSDLNDSVLLDKLDNSVPFNVPYSFDNEVSSLMQLIGKIPEGFRESINPFILLRLDIYPDNNFNFEDAYALLNVSIPEETEELINN